MVSQHPIRALDMSNSIVILRVMYALIILSPLENVAIRLRNIIYVHNRQMDDSSTFFCNVSSIVQDFTLDCVYWFIFLDAT